MKNSKCKPVNRFYYNNTEPNEPDFSSDLINVDNLPKKTIRNVQFIYQEDSSIECTPKHTNT